MSLPLAARLMPDEYTQPSRAKRLLANKLELHRVGVGVGIRAGRK